MPIYISNLFRPHQIFLAITSLHVQVQFKLIRTILLVIEEGYTINIYVIATKGAVIIKSFVMGVCGIVRTQ